LAGLPAGLRAGALPIVIDEQFSGRCPVPEMIDSKGSALGAQAVGWRVVSGDEAP
jgi:hypothetical protein